MEEVLHIRAKNDTSASMSQPKLVVALKNRYIVA
jgi:hypothetical protein